MPTFGELLTYHFEGTTNISYKTPSLAEVLFFSEAVAGNVPDEFIADPETVDDDGTITIIVREDVYEVRIPARGFCRKYPIERPGQELTEREGC